MLDQIGELLIEDDEESLGKFMTALVPAIAHAVRLGYAEGLAESNGD
jgi:hypothetical protein